MWFDPMSFDPRSLYHMSFDPKSFDPMSVTQRELMLTDKAKVEARNLTFSKRGGAKGKYSAHSAEKIWLAPS